MQRWPHRSIWVRPRRVSLAVAVALLAALVVGSSVQATGATNVTGRSATLNAGDTSAAQPPGFSESVVFSGLNEPTAMRFSPDGRVFVAEKSGLIKVFDSLSDPTPTVFANLRTKVFSSDDDRGLLGLALDPNFPSKPYVYALYTYDAAIGGTAPRWGTPGAAQDTCPTPPGPRDDGCVVSGRLSRLQANGDKMTGSEKVLINGWCQQFPSHSVGDLQFAPNGALYVSGGEGAAWWRNDYGQIADNPCGDPSGGSGGAQTPPTAEGGALRAQSVRRPAGQPRDLGGTILRVDPATGNGLPGNPLASSTNANARRIVSYGLRNPYRFVVRSGELWIAEVGQSNIEEIDRDANPIDSHVKNFGWPCYEGANPQPEYKALGLNICKGLYSNPGTASIPFYGYRHANQVVPGESCPTGSSAISGLAFYPGGPYPAEYDGTLFFADAVRGCIWAMEQPAGSGTPSPQHIKTFDATGGAPVDLQVGPDGNLYYVDFFGGEVRKITYTPGGN
jgi:glucose/arabinose dehydrogenase